MTTMYTSLRQVDIVNNFGKANLTLNVYEAEYIERLLHQGKNEDARLHTNTKKFMDDTICFGTETPSSE